jgi:hypothetical protein
MWSIGYEVQNEFELPKGELEPMILADHVRNRALECSQGPDRIAPILKELKGASVEEMVCSETR